MSDRRSPPCAPRHDPGTILVSASSPGGAGDRSPDAPARADPLGSRPERAFRRLDTGDPLGGPRPSARRTGYGRDRRATPAPRPAPAARSRSHRRPRRRPVLAGWWRRVGAALIDGVDHRCRRAGPLRDPRGGSGSRVDSNGGAVALIVGALLARARDHGRGVPLRAADDGAHQRPDARADGARHPRHAGRRRPDDFGFAMLREVLIKALLFGVHQLGHVRARLAARRAVAAVGRGEPRAPRLRREHARDQDLASPRRARRRGRRRSRGRPRSR